MSKIILAENDPWLGKQVAELLRDQRHDCVVVPTIDGLMQLIDQQSPELVMLDRLLDDGDSLSVVDQIRSLRPAVKVLILSQLSHCRERILGLDRGAHDYLVKPFNSTELLLKVKRLLELSVVTSRSVLTSANWRLDLESGNLTELPDSTVHLRRKEAQLVAALMRWSPQTVSRDRLIDEVWGDQPNAPLYSTLDVYIRRIRIKIKHPLAIQTVRGFGYRWTHDVGREAR